MRQLARSTLVIFGTFLATFLVATFPTTSLAQKKVSEYEKITKKVLTLMREMATELRKIKDVKTAAEVKPIVKRIDSEIVEQIKAADKLVKEKGMPELKEKILLQGKYQAAFIQADMDLRDAIRRARLQPGGKEVVDQLTMFQRKKKKDKKNDKK